MALKKISFKEISKIANYYKTTESEWQGKKGIFYFLTENLTEAQRKELSGYNCEILESRSQFAPELKKTIIFTPKNQKTKKMKNITIYDNGGKTIDRITVIFNDRKRVTKDGVLYECIAASETGNGFYIHSEAMNGRHLGKKIDFSKLSLPLQNKLLIEINN